MKGYTGNVIKINLTENKIIKDTITDQFCENFIGGYGFGAKVLWDELEAGIDPLGSDNVLVLATGSAAGTILPTSSNCCVFAKSPLTGFFGMEIIHGSIGQQMKRAGYDLIQIKGKAPDPVYIVINDEDIKIRSAKDLWGKKDTDETEKFMKKNYKDNKLAVVSIGKAGENLLPIACLRKNKNRPAGRTGLGAVMGSKNLKCIGISGTKSVEIAEHDIFLEKSYELIQTASGQITKKYRDLGTQADILTLNKIGALPTHNFNDGTFNKAGEISGELFAKDWEIKRFACSNCPIACNHVSLVPKGKYKDSYASIDYHSLVALGSCCGVADIPSIIKAIELCDNNGLDTISTGVSIAFGMECFEKEIIDEKITEGLELKFGNEKALIQMIEDIANKRTKAGKILSEGTKNAAETWKKDSEKFAMNIKGLELPGYSPRTLQTAALGFSVSIIGGSHIRSGAYLSDINGEFDRMKTDPDRVQTIIETENLYGFMDSLIICKFSRDCYSGADELAEVYQLISGIEMSENKLLKIGERIHNLAKCFNIREGATRNDDYPPDRVFEEELKNEPNRGAIIDRNGFDKMLDEYYKNRGWTKDGIPSKAKLKELGLDFCIDEVGAK
ncbi:MAG: hypothetical protein GF329_09205 [Candidatus Lokiarchaeota archaeon]|nr:hypothetical protein [Candidatus Lokiarchaeota archaeon]